MEPSPFQDFNSTRCSQELEEAEPFDGEGCASQQDGKCCCGTEDCCCSSLPTHEESECFSKKRKIDSSGVAQHQRIFFDLWTKFITMFQSPAGFNGLCAPMLVLCLMFMGPFCNWCMALSDVITNEYGVTLDPSNPVDAALLLVHIIAAAKAERFNTDLYTVRNREMHCAFPPRHSVHIYTSACICSNAMLLFVVGCMTGLHAMNMHKKYLTQCFRPRGSEPATGCPNKRREVACFNWLQQLFRKMPEPTHLEIVHIIQDIWKEKRAPHQDKFTFSSARFELEHNDHFLAITARVEQEKARREALTLTSPPVADSNDAKASTPMDIASRSHIEAEPTEISQQCRPRSDCEDHQDCPLGALATSFRMRKQEFVNYLMAKGSQLCRDLTEAQAAIGASAANDQCFMRCTSKIPQLQGDPQDMLFLDNSGQFVVRPSKPRCMQPDENNCTIS